MEHRKWRPSELLEAANQKPNDFVALLQRALASDFDSAFRFLKTQKLLLRQRSLAWTTAVQVGLEQWISTAPLKGKQKAQLKRHLEVSKTIQELLDFVDRQSSELRIWQASTETLLRALFGWVQEHEDKCEQLKPASAFSDNLAALTFMEYQRKALRHGCDYVGRIVNQISLLGPREAGTVSVETGDVKAAVAAASLADLVMHVLDCYSYKNFRVSVDGKHVELHALKSEIEDAGTWSTLRGGTRSLVKAVGSGALIEDVLQFARSFSVSSDSFADFLDSDDGKKVFEKLEEFCAEHDRSMRGDVEELIDLNFTLRTEAGVFRVEQLLDCWSFLFRLALCTHVWRSAFSKRAVPIVKCASLSNFMSKTLGFDRDNTEMLLSQFSLTPGARNQDPFFRPLIRLNAQDYLIAGPFIETGRFGRNLFTIAIREGRVDFSAKGLKPLRTIEKELNDAGYAALINVPLHGPQGTITDVDIAATKDGYLFVGQTKVLINPDTVYDDWKVQENLSKASKQLESSLANVSQIAAKLGLAAGEYVLVPFLLTNVWDFTGAAIGGFKVVDFSYLSFLLRGAEMWNINPGPVPTRQIVKLISGKYPTGEELCRFLRRSIHEQMFQKPKIEKSTISVGSWRLTFPVDAAKQPNLRPGLLSVEV